MNILDLIVLIIITLCIIFCAARGLLISLFNLLSIFISFILAIRLQPFISELLRDTALFGALKNLSLGWLGPRIPDTGQVVTDAIEGMALPELFKRATIDYIQRSNITLDIAQINDFVAEYAAGLAIDAISILLVFVGVFLLMRIIAVLLRIVSRLPVIRTFNRIGGAILGLFMGIIISWLVLSVMNGLFGSSPEFNVGYMLADSTFAYRILNIFLM